MILSHWVSLRTVALFMALMTSMILAVHSEYWLGLKTQHPLGADFFIYVGAVLKAQDGFNPYDPYSIGSSFVYHPFALTFVSAFAWLDPEAALAVWSVGTWLAWATSIVLAFECLPSLSRDAGLPEKHGIRRPQRLLLFALFLFFAPFLETMHIGQINAFVCLCLMLALYLAERGVDWGAGLCVAVAALLKTSPVVVVLYFLALRRYRVVGATLLFGALFTIVPGLQFGAQILTDYMHILSLLGREVFPSVYNESLISVLHIWVSQRPSFIAMSLLLFRLIFIGWLCLLFIPILRRRAMTISSKYRLRLFAAVLATMVVFSNLIWYHHGVFLLLPLLLLITHSGRIIPWVGLALLLLAQAQRLFEQVFALQVGVPAAFSYCFIMVLLTILALRELKLNSANIDIGMSE